VIPFPGAAQAVPPVLLRDGQHFSDFGMSIFDPLTTHACGAPNSRALAATIQLA